jgi:hypothetical protein
MTKEQIIEILEQHQYKIDEDEQYFKKLSDKAINLIANAILAIEQKESKGSAEEISNPEEYCKCSDGGIWLDGYYDTRCDRCKKRW